MNSSSTAGADENMEECFKRAQEFMSYLEKLQFQCFDGRPEWTTITIPDLKLFMAYTYFGYPNITNDMDSEEQNIFKLYKNDEQECIIDMCTVIDNILKKIQSNNNSLKDLKDLEIQVGITMVHSTCKSKCEVCVNQEEPYAHTWYLLRIKKNRNEIYVDLSHKRTYKDFNDYIENNELPSGLMFFPASGMYEECNYLVSKLTPPSRKKGMVFNSLDTISKWLSGSAGLVLAAGIFSPLISPILMASAAGVVSTACGYDICRETIRLTNLAQHNRSLVSGEAMNHWLNLVISVMGTITAPLNAIRREIGVEGLRRSLSILHKGACIAQFSLEVLRCSWKILNDGNRISAKDIISLRLDLFVVVGSLLPISFVREVLEVMVCTVIGYGLRIIDKLPDLAYCVGQHIMRNVCYVTRHLNVFADKLTKFVAKHLTVDKALCAWQVFRKCMDVYRQNFRALRGPDLLRHIVHDLMAVPCDAESKEALCGPLMTELLDGLRVADDRHAIELCVRRVLDVADRVRGQYRDAVAELARRGIFSSDDIDAEFCRQYGLSACRYDQFVLHGIRRATDDGPDAFWAAYGAVPRTVRDEIHVAGHRTGERTLDAFATTAPPEGVQLSTAFCRQFATAVDPSNAATYSGSEHMSLPDNSSVLFSASAFSVRLVLFHVDSSAGRPPSLNVCIFGEPNTGCASKTLRFG